MINDFADLKLFPNSFRKVLTFAYKENLPLSLRRNNRNNTCWSHNIAERRRKHHRLFNAAKIEGI
jgi:hypothetical protein